MRYLQAEIERDLFIEYFEDQNVLMAIKVPFNDDLDSSSHLDAYLSYDVLVFIESLSLPT